MSLTPSGGAIRGGGRITDECDEMCIVHLKGNRLCYYI